jgi:hypothetical protein
MKTAMAFMVLLAWIVSLLCKGGGRSRVLYQRDAMALSSRPCVQLVEPASRGVLLRLSVLRHSCRGARQVTCGSEAASSETAQPVIDETI